MKMQRIAVALTAINLVLLLLALSQARIHVRIRQAMQHTGGKTS